MSYGLKYQCEFDQLSNEVIRYRLEFHFKDYSGPIRSIKGGSVPVLHNWQDDNPKATIKGSNLEITLMNEGSVPLKSFYSNDDNGVLVMFFHGSNLRFIGFLVQDDFSEPLIDFNHEIKLSATDGLGLLKDITFGTIKGAEQNVVKIYENADVIKVAPHGLVVANCNYRPEVGVQFIFDNILYTPTAVIDGSGFYTVTVTNTVTTTSSQNGYIYTYGYFDPYERNNLFAIIQACIRNTYIQGIKTRVFCNLYELATKAGNSVLQQVHRECESLLEKNCYDVLEIILKPLGLTLFQADGYWNIIRWDELKYYNNLIPGFIYDQNEGLLLSQTTFDKQFITGHLQATDITTGLLGRVYRSFKYFKRTFNYNINPPLFNDNLQRLGNLVGTITSGDFTTKTYELPTDIPVKKLWIHKYSDASKIVVVTNDDTGIESDRYLLQPKIDNGGGSGFAGFPCIQLNDVEVTTGDRLSFSFRAKTKTTTSDNVRFRAAFFIAVNNTYNYQLTATGPSGLRWNKVTSPTTDGLGISITFPGDEAKEYINFDLNNFLTDGYKIPRFPEDGLLRIRIMGTNDSNVSQPDVDCIIKDITLTVTNYINDSIKIIGQYHNNSQSTNTNNREEIEISMDDSPRNVIDGTLFRTNFSGFLQSKTAKWKRGHLVESKNLGEITTYEDLQWRSKTRGIIEGNFINLIQDDQMVSMATVFRNTIFPGENFIAGNMSIDYKAGRFTANLWNLYNDDEVNIPTDYKFEYLYKSE